jgi:hypothetical protein
VRERAPPHRWAIEGGAEGGGSAVIAYRLTTHDGGTSFERALAYRMPNLWLAILDRLFIRRRMAAESAKALRRLKLILERAPAEGHARPA